MNKHSEIVDFLTNSDITQVKKKSSKFVSNLFLNKILILARGHRSVTCGDHTKSSKSRRKRGEDRGTPYDTGSSTKLNSRGSRRHHRNNHGSLAKKEVSMHERITDLTSI